MSSKKPIKEEMCTRLAKPEDIPGMMALEREAGTAAHWREEDYLRIFEQGGVLRVALVAQESDALAGFLVAGVAGDQWEIENVAVAEDLKRQGIGSRLVRELITTARTRGVESIFLEVRASNEAARKMYEKCSFAVVACRAGYYRNPEEDALIYRLKLERD